MDMNAQSASSVQEQQPASALGKSNALTMQSIKKQYFLANQSKEATAAIDSALALVKAEEGEVVFNFDPEKEIPTGYDFVVAPINQRDTNLNITKVIGVSVGAIPTYELMLQTPEGAAWIKEQATNNILAKLANAVRPNKQGEIASTIPFTVSDFITSNRAEGVLVAYRKFAPKFIKALKERGFVNLIDATFRQTLQSSAFAEQTFPNVPQSVWENIIQKMISLASEEGMIAGMLVDWVENRNTAGLPDISEIDIDGLADLDI